MDEARQTRRELMGSLVVAGTGLALAGASSVGAAPLNSLPTTDFGEKYDVRRFGAQGDGKTDDTRAVQTAIDAALKAGGGHIHFPAGQYRITRSLRFASLERVDVTGVGGSSTLLHENDEPLLLWPEGVSCREVSVRHL
ncbi:MAG: hypothetical protein JOZ57_15475, partial [Abitibacteriaceae bacterium]|nr:hypothetical protein [Abditibacteriaceae bacterium]